jgi:hypothetical protein
MWEALAMQDLVQHLVVAAVKVNLEMQVLLVMQEVMEILVQTALVQQQAILALRVQKEMLV